MQRDEIKARVREFLGRTIRNQALADDQDIFAAGFVNSLFAMQLVMFVEQEFGFGVSDDDLVIDNFRTVEMITQLVERCAPVAAR